MERYRDQLIQQGMWNPNDPGDPAADEEAAQVVEEWINKQVAPFVQFQIVDVPEIYNLPPWYRPLMVWSDGDNGPIVEPLIVQEDQESLSTRLKAICAGALAIRRFLYLHPECAAQGQSGD